MPGQRVLREPLESRLREAPSAAVLALGDAREKVPGEHGDVLAPLAEGHDVERQDVQPVVEVLAQRLLLHGLDEVAVRARNDAHVARKLLVPADPSERARLEDAQELDLQVRRHLA